MSIIIKDLEEKLGEEKVEEIVNKEWNIAEPPTPEELAEERSKSPKARNNPNSRKNLAQYNKRSKEQKEKALDNLKVVEKEEDIDPNDIFGSDVDPSISKMFDSIVRPKEVFKTRAEQDIFYTTIKLCLGDFDIKELSFSDFEDIAKLAKNRVLEYRLLKAAKSEKMLLEASNTLERFSKDSEKIKSSLANRRVDRIDTKNKPAFSIVELVAHLDHQKKLDFTKRIEDLEKEQDTFVPALRDDEGNPIEG